MRDGQGKKHLVLARGRLLNTLVIGLARMLVENDNKPLSIEDPNGAKLGEIGKEWSDPPFAEGRNLSRGGEPNSNQSR